MPQCLSLPYSCPFYFPFCAAAAVLWSLRNLLLPSNILCTWPCRSVWAWQSDTLRKRDGPVLVYFEVLACATQLRIQLLVSDMHQLTDSCHLYVGHVANKETLTFLPVLWDQLLVGFRKAKAEFKHGEVCLFVFSPFFSLTGVSMILRGIVCGQLFNIWEIRKHFNIKAKADITTHFKRKLHICQLLEVSSCTWISD